MKVPKAEEWEEKGKYLREIYSERRSDKSATERKEGLERTGDFKEGLKEGLGRRGEKKHAANQRENNENKVTAAPYGAGIRMFTGSKERRKRETVREDKEKEFLRQDPLPTT